MFLSNLTSTFMAAFGCVGQFPALFFKITTKCRNHVSYTFKVKG